jgi:small subunit ribosomal protein S9
LPDVTRDASATGRRKTSVARVSLVPGSGQFRVNGRTLEDYFPRESLRSMIVTPLQLAGIAGRYDVRASLSGGGVSGQAGALRHGIARAVQLLDPGHRPVVKRAGLLTRDSRMVERKKYGQRGARARFQFSKR